MTEMGRAVQEKKGVIQQKERAIRDNERLIQTLLVHVYVHIYCTADTERMGGGWWVGLEGNTLVC